MVPEPTAPSAATPDGTGKRHPARAIRNYLIAGLMIWIPVMITVWVIRFLSSILDQSLVLLPPSWRPEALVGTYVPGVGIILSLLLLLVTGMVVRNLFGGQIVASAENLVRRIPVVGAIYGGAKSFSETVLTDKGRSFKQVVLVEFPRRGMFAVGFITSEELEEVQAKTSQDVVCVFVPTTPNPTTGFLVAIPRGEIVVLDMSVDEAFRMLLTLGVVVPRWKHRPQNPDLAPHQTPP